MAYEEKERQAFGRSAKFCVVQHDALAMLNLRGNDLIVEAQKQVDDNMLNALEEMVKAARAGKLEGKAALGLACVAW